MRQHELARMHDLFPVPLRAEGAEAALLDGATAARDSLVDQCLAPMRRPALLDRYPHRPLAELMSACSDQLASGPLRSCALADPCAVRPWEVRRYRQAEAARPSRPALGPAKIEPRLTGLSARP